MVVCCLKWCMQDIQIASDGIVVPVFLSSTLNGLNCADVSLNNIHSSIHPSSPGQYISVYLTSCFLMSVTVVEWPFGVLKPGNSLVLI